MSHRTVISALLALLALALPAAASAAPSTGAVLFSMVSEDHREYKDAEGNVLPPKAPEGGIYAVRDRQLNQLTDNPVDAEPWFAPDGRTIAFVRDGDVFAMRADGSGLRQLTSGPEVDSKPQIAPNGRYLVFERSAVAGGERDLYTVRIGGGSAASTLVSSAADEHEATFAPNGRLLAFVRSREVLGGRSADDVFTVRPSGAKRRRLTRTGAIDEWNPRFVRGGIAFSRGVHAAGQAGYADIYSIRADGRAKLKPIVRGVGSAYVEDVSADGRTLLFHRDQGLWVKPIGKRGRLLHSLEDGVRTNAVFSSDGRKVAVYSAAESEQSILAIDVKTGRSGYADVFAYSGDEVTTTIGPVLDWQPTRRR